jgi:hypothetical protein
MADFPGPTAEGIGSFVSRILVACPDMRSVWRIDLRPDEERVAPDCCELLAFADPLTLRRLRKLADLHRADVELLVVVDGDAFESAWGPRKAAGSLSRWGWQQVSSIEAYYDRSCWRGDGQVMRLRRKAVLVIPACAKVRT